MQNVTIRLSGDFDKKRSEPAKHTIIAIINVLKIKNGITHSTTEKEQKVLEPLMPNFE